MASATLSIRIPKETKKKMKEVDVDWSDYIQNAIEDKIKKYQREKAAESMDAIRERTKQKAFDSAKSIIEDRNA